MIIVKYISDRDHTRKRNKYSEDRSIVCDFYHDLSFNEVVDKITREYSNTITARDRIHIIEVGSKSNMHEIIPPHIIR